MPTVALGYSPVMTFLTNDGRPLAGGLLYTYGAGSSTPSPTYIDSTGATPNTNPITLNNRGDTANNLGVSCGVWWPPGTALKFVLTDAAGNPIWTQDNVTQPITAVTIPVGSVTDASLAPSSVIYAIDQPYFRTQAEINATLTPTNLGYPSHLTGWVLPERYGAVGNGNAADAANGALDTTAIANAVLIAVATGTPILLSRKYIAVPATVTTQEGMAITVMAVMQSNLHVVGERGASITMANNQSTDVAPKNLAFFFTNAVLSNVSFRNVIFDMNGTNNPISPGRLNNVVTTGAGGTGATATITFAVQPFAAPVGSTIVVTGVTPVGYNTVPSGAVVSASTTSSVSYANTTVGAQTIAGQVSGGYNSNFNQGAIAVSGTPNGLAAHIDDILIEGCTFKNNPGSCNVVCGQTNNLGAAIALTAGPAAGAVSATLSGAWGNATGAYRIRFSDTEVRDVTLTNGATTATWGQPLYTASPQGSITFTAGLGSGALSGTLTGVWPNATGQWQVTFSTGEIRLATLTNGSTAATWTPALTSAATASATYGHIYTQVLGKRWMIRKNLFLNNGTDHLDFSSVFGWCDEVTADSNYFWSDLAPHTIGLTGPSSSLEIHGARSIYVNNVVYNYRNGLYVANNYSSDVQDVTVANNHFFTTDWGMIIFRINTGFALNGIDIHDNHWYFDNYQYIGQNTYRAAVLFQGQYSQQQYAVNNVKIHDNQAICTGFSLQSYFVRWETPVTVAGNVTSNLSITGNQAVGFNTGVYLLTNAANSQGLTEISRNQWFNFNPDSLANQAVGLNINPTGGITTLILDQNEFIDERATPAFQLGIFMSAGTITDFFFGQQTFKGLTSFSFNNAGTFTNMRSSFVNNGSQANVADGGTITHSSGFTGITPRSINITPTVAGTVGTVTSITQPTCVVALRVSTTNAAAANQTVYFAANY